MTQAKMTMMRSLSPRRRLILTCAAEIEKSKKEEKKTEVRMGEAWVRPAEKLWASAAFSNEFANNEDDEYHPFISCEWMKLFRYTFFL